MSSNTRTASKAAGPVVSTGTGALVDQMLGLAAGITPKEFSTGSKGFHAQGKVHTAEGTFQCQILMTLIGSKANPGMILAGTGREAALGVGPLVHRLAAKEFSSGKPGYFATGKVAVANQMFQVNVQAVRLG